MTILGSALGTWWIATRPRTRAVSGSPRDRGTVIFHNTPEASDVSPIL
jgi:hypothetical protein